MHDNDDDEKDSGDVWSVTSSSKDDSGSGVDDAGGVKNIASAAVLNDDDDKDDDDKDDDDKDDDDKDDDDKDDDDNGVDGVDIGCGDDDDDDVDIGVCEDDVGLDGAVGVHTKLLSHGRFLEAENVINILQSASSTANSDCIPEVPRGQKDNVYFFVNNGKNVERRKQGKQIQFWDDRGAWVGGSTSRTFYVRENGKLKSIPYRQGKYCKVSNKDNKRFIQVPLAPQPEARDVIHLNRYYAKHGTGAKYEKRVSFLVGEDVAAVAIYEFKGCCPVLAPQTYIRTKPAIMEKIKDEVKKKKQVRITPTQVVQYVKGHAIEGKFITSKLEPNLVARPFLRPTLRTRWQHLRNCSIRFLFAVNCPSKSEGSHHYSLHRRSDKRLKEILLSSSCSTVHCVRYR